MNNRLSAGAARWSACVPINSRDAATTCMIRAACSAGESSISSSWIRWNFTRAGGMVISNKYVQRTGHLRQNWARRGTARFLDFNYEQEPWDVGRSSIVRLASGKAQKSIARSLCNRWRVTSSPWEVITVLENWDYQF